MDNQKAEGEHHDQNGWVRLAAVADCPQGEGREFAIHGRLIALFHLEDRFAAIDGVCPHQGGPLGQGELNGCVVTCPWHGWQYDVTTGCHTSLPNLKQDEFQLKVVDEEIFIQLP